MEKFMKISPRQLTTLIKEAAFQTRFDDMTDEELNDLIRNAQNALKDRAKAAKRANVGDITQMKETIMNVAIGDEEYDDDVMEAIFDFFIKKNPKASKLVKRIDDLSGTMSNAAYELQTMNDEDPEYGHIERQQEKDILKLEKMLAKFA